MVKHPWAFLFYNCILILIQTQVHVIFYKKTIYLPFIALPNLFLYLIYFCYIFLSSAAFFVNQHKNLV